MFLLLLACDLAGLDIHIDGTPGSPDSPGSPGMHRSPNGADALGCFAEREKCNGIDDDCDGSVDEEAVDGEPGWVDRDGDGWGAASWGVCPGDPDEVESGGDCDDDNAAAHPDGTETCLTTGDEDCDGEADEEGATGCALYTEDTDGDGVGDGDSACLCDGGDGWVAVG